MSQEEYITSKAGADLLGVPRQSFFYYVESRNIRKRETNRGGKDKYEYNYEDLLNIRDDIQAKMSARKKSTSPGTSEATRLRAENQVTLSGATDWATNEDLPYIYALDCDIYGIEYSVPANKTLQWKKKNPTMIRVLFNANNRKEIWGCLTIMPMKEEVIFDLLRGDMSEQEITSEHILEYEPGKDYSCYIASCVIRPEKSHSFNLLLNSTLNYWCDHSDIHLHKFYGFAAGASVDNLTAANDGMRLVKKLYFSPRYDIDKNAWELNLDYYNPSPIIQKFQNCLQSKQGK
jgi:hypothetical protein